MSRTLLFLILFTIGISTIATISMGYWLKILIAIAVITVLGGFMMCYLKRDDKTMQNIRSSEFTPRKSTNGKEEKFRNIVEKEWNKSVFDNADDLK